MRLSSRYNTVIGNNRQALSMRVMNERWPKEVDRLITGPLDWRVNRMREGIDVGLGEDAEIKWRSRDSERWYTKAGEEVRW